MISYANDDPAGRNECQTIGIAATDKGSGLNPRFHQAVELIGVRRWSATRSSPC